MHVECLNQHAMTSYTCPICHKCLTDMSDWYQQLDERLAQEVIPPEFAKRMSRVLCYDCDRKSVVPFHFVYHKCGHKDCGAYNTRVLESLDRVETGDDNDGDISSGGSVRSVKDGGVDICGRIPSGQQQTTNLAPSDDMRSRDASELILLAEQSRVVTEAGT